MSTALPDRIARLDELASDLSWSWNPQAREVFRILDYPVWRQTAHNPVRMLRAIAPDRLDRAAGCTDRACFAGQCRTEVDQPQNARCPRRAPAPGRPPQDDSPQLSTSELRPHSHSVIAQMPCCKVGARAEGSAHCRLARYACCGIGRLGVGADPGNVIPTIGRQTPKRSAVW